MANAAHKRPQNCFDRDEQLSVAVIHLRLEYGPPTVHVIHTYEVRPRKGHRGVDLISDALPIRPAEVWRAKCGEQRNHLREFSQPFT